ICPFESSAGPLKAVGWRQNPRKKNANLRLKGHRQKEIAARPSRIAYSFGGPVGWNCSNGRGVATDFPAAISCDPESDPHIQQ
ncbi:hypothetical protein, partial [Sinorhizobium medicae]|uniref:hypothetical protein n=2 Tax=Sinorhizobium medicae TaxID=110321 RepID=UPI002B1BDDF1